MFSAINQQIALKTLRKFGFTGHAVWNGKEAIDYLMSTAQPGSPNPKPDVILMDVQMPVIDGYRATHILRHHAPFNHVVKDIPIVAMTASAIQGDREKCKKAGMDDYLAKPVKGKTLEKMLVRWVIQKRLPRTPGESVSSSDEHGSDCEEAANFTFVDPKSTEALIDKGLGVPDATRSTPAPEGSSLARPPLSARTNSHHLTLPGTESEGDRVARRNAAEEKATSLRDDKLIVAAGGSDEGAIPQIRGSGGQQLTEANVSRLESTGLRSPRLKRVDTDDDSIRAVGAATPDLGTPLKGNDGHDMLGTSSGKGKGAALGPKPERPVFHRFQDSERTIKPDDMDTA